jgi:branched-chain amino acid transport system substrate-binding protein
MTSFHHARLRLSVGLALSGLMVATMAACGKDHTPAKPTATGTPVKIGVVASLSGKPLPGTAAVEGFKAWARTVNGRGGLLGHPVEVVVKDDGNDPVKSLTAVKELVEKDGVAAISSWTGVDTSWADYVQKQQVPVVGGQNYSPVWQENPVLFPVQSTLGTAMTSQPLMAKNAGAHTIGSYYTADVANAVQAVKAIDAIATSLGLNATFSAAISSSQPSFIAPCLAAKKAGVDAMMIAGLPVERITPSCAQQGYKPMWILPGEVVTSEVLKTPQLGDVLAPQMAFPFFVDNAATKDYRSAMKTNYRGAKDEMFSPLTASAWMTGLVYQQAFANIGTTTSVTSADILGGLYQVKSLTAGGLLPGLTYAKDQKQRTVGCFWETRVHDGKWVAPNELKTTCISG